MNKKFLFCGCATAMVTPFKGGGVDYNGLVGLIDRQVSAGVDCLVVCGTTGEAPTLSDREHKRVLSVVKNRVGDKITLVAGCGSNDTRHAVMMTRFAKSIGYDGALIVAPYYNKTTDNGLIGHYFAVADKGDLPIIVYNVPKRTGVDISVDVYKRLCRHPNIVGVKEASGDTNKMANLISAVKGRVKVYTGNDSDILQTAALGGDGVISVVSNIAPRTVTRLWRLYQSGDVSGARKLFYTLLPLVSELFKEVNPIPVKHALSKLKLCDNRLRAPLLPMEDHKNLDKLLEDLKEYLV